MTGGARRLFTLSSLISASFVAATGLGSRDVFLMEVFFLLLSTLISSDGVMTRCCERVGRGRGRGEDLGSRSPSSLASRSSSPSTSNPSRLSSPRLTRAKQRTACNCEGISLKDIGIELESLIVICSPVSLWPRNGDDVDTVFSNATEDMGSHDCWVGAWVET